MPDIVALEKLPPLRDRVRRPVRVLFVGINPGVRSAQTGHHFAGFSNRFWKLLYDAGIVPEAIGYRDDRRLPQWGLGITNLIARATPGIDTLKPAEYREGLAVLRRKVRRWQPEVVAFVGVTVFRAACGRPVRTPVKLGIQRERFEGARVVVLPNPSGRNANFSYAEMVVAFRSLQRFCREQKPQSPRHTAHPPPLLVVQRDDRIHARRPVRRHVARER